MIKVPKERRKSKDRLNMSLPCSVSADDKTSEEGNTFDISKGGMCVFTDKCLDTGEVIEVRCEAIWDKPKKGAVRWCQKVTHSLYRVGIQFV